MRLTFGDFAIDLDQRRLLAGGPGGNEVRLQPKAFEVLRALVEARPKALSKEEILARVWPGSFISENSLATVVRDLRIALGDDAQEPRFIRTAYGYGYSFVGDAEAGTTAPAGATSRWRLIYQQREITLREGRNILGRDGQKVVVFDSPTVSRQHAVVHVDGDRATVEDLGSKNGTWVGVTQTVGRVPLDNGAELRLGSVVTVVRFDEAMRTTETIGPA